MVVRQLSQQLENLRRHNCTNANAYESSIEDEDFTCERYRGNKLAPRKQQPTRKPHNLEIRKNDIGVDVKMKNFRDTPIIQDKRPEKPYLNKSEPKYAAKEEIKHVPVARASKLITPMMKYKLDNPVSLRLKNTLQVNSAFTHNNANNAELPQEENEDDDSLFEDAEEEPEQKPRREVNVSKIKNRVNMMINRPSNLSKSPPVKLKEVEVSSQLNIPLQKYVLIATLHSILF